ncbi:cadherin-like beta sandwich domain-containing protein [Paenibacillus piri]|uniref:Uncharacterized protein n=1 Tax=Paenibacillus piri TaxID=2547395 RepID=A0A4R5KNG1_9BACL|nr:cadherin-like beta sandwich domain-containing protein [Paenibacillus piri]TDF97096.1 hypothetical protein E1757_14740 [Paenibacillus piri]
MPILQTAAHHRLSSAGNSRIIRFFPLLLCMLFLSFTLALLPSAAYAYGTSGSNAVYKAVSASYSHTAAVRSDGTLWTWGSNSNGQLGYAVTGTDQRSPKPVEELSDIVSVATGGNPDTGSAFTVAIDASGRVYAAGSNDKGQLGDGTTIGRASFYPVKGNNGLDLIVPNGKLAAGFDFAGVLNEDGAAWTWGDNEFGQLGNQDPTAANHWAVLVKTDEANELRGITQLSLGGQHGLALVQGGDTGTVYSWGRNNRGQLGTDAPLDNNSIYAGAIGTSFADKSVSMIAAGSYHSIAYSASEGERVWSWGDNTRNQLGIGIDWITVGYPWFEGTYSPIPRPVQFNYGPGYSLFKAPAAIAAGGEQIVILDNLDGIAGLEYVEGNKGWPVQRDLPAGMGEVVAVAAGYQQTFALTADGKLWGKGTNDHGQLGLGDKGPAFAPEFVPTLFPLLSELKSLTAAEGALEPAFKHYEHEYILNVGGEADHVNLSASAYFSNAVQIKIGETIYPGNQFSTPVPVQYGSNMITVQVIGSDHSTTDYILVINRAAPDSTDLDQIISAASLTYANTSEGILPWQYRPGSRAALQTAIVAAQTVRDNSGSTQSDLDKARDALLQAMTVFAGQLSPSRGPIVSLLGQAEELRGHAVEWQYEPGSITALQTAIVTAIAVRDNELSSQAELEAAAAALQTAIFVFKAKELPSIPVIFFDFESGDGRFADMEASGAWTHAALASGDLQAHSGSKAWALNLSGQLSDERSSTLISGPLDLRSDNVQGFKLSWWQYNVPGFEYTNVPSVSKDGGKTWELMPVNYVKAGEWAKRSITLDPSYAVSNVKFKIETATSRLVPVAMLIDDVKIERYTTDINQLIASAQNLYQASVEGMEPGQFVSGSKAMLQQAISAAIIVRDSSPGIEAADAAVTALKKALQDFLTYKYAPGVIYSSDFESSPGGFETSGSPSWQYGTPATGPQAAHSGNKVWGTNLYGLYADNQDSYLTSPPIDLSSAAGAAGTDGTDGKLTLSWWQWVDIEQGYDFIEVAASKDGGASWSEALLSESGGESKWVLRKIILDSSYAVPDFRFQFHFSSDDSVTKTGVFLDDAAISILDTSSLADEIGQAQQLLGSSQEGNAAGYYEVGAKASLNAALIIAQSEIAKPLQYQKKLDDAIAAIQQAIAQFKTKLKQPNMLFHTDFETNNGGFTTTGTNSSWAYGTPGSGPAQAASGTKLWATNLSGNFNSGENSVLVSPPIPAAAADAWKLSVSWMQWVDIPSCCGSIKVEASKDGGASWQTVFSHTRDEVTDPLSAPIMNSVWQPMQVDLDPSYLVSDLRVRFHFQWGYSKAPGWYIDNVGVAAYPKDLGFTVMQAESLLAHSSEGTGTATYPAGSKAVLQQQVDSAKIVLLHAGATPDQLQSAQSVLNEAIAQFRSKFITGSLHQVAKGSYVTAGGKKWLVWEPGQNGLLLGMEHVREIGDKVWSYAADTSPGLPPSTYNTYNPAKEGTLANYLNGAFFDSLNSQKDWIVSKSWNVRDESNTVVYGTGSVDAKVGLLTVAQYKALSDYPEYGGDHTLNHEEWGRYPSYPWWLITPKSEEDGGRYIHLVDISGSIDYDSAQHEYAVRPTIYLNDSIGVVGGSGTADAPYQLADLSGNKDLTNLTSSHGTVMPTAEGGYRVEVPSVVNSVYLNWNISPFARIGSVTNAVYDPAGWFVSLPKPGDQREVTVTVIASNQTETHYKITIVRAADAGDPANTSLTLVSNTGLVENTGANSFQIKVPNETTTVLLTPTVHPAALVSLINGSVTGAVYSGGIIQVPQLMTGSNTFGIKVSTPVTDSFYAVNIIRAAPDGQGGNGTDVTKVMSGAVEALRSGNQFSFHFNSVTQSVYFTIQPAEASAQFKYAGGTVTGATYRMKGSSFEIYAPTLQIGTNQLLFKVISADGTKEQAYTILAIVDGASGEAQLGQPIPVSASYPAVKFRNGVAVDLTGVALGPNAILEANDSTDPYDTSILKAAGPVMAFTLKGAAVDRNHPVRLEFPVISGADNNRVGIFYYNDQAHKWEYQPTAISADGRASAYVSHFSTYGVFQANRVEPVQASEVRLPNGESVITLTTATTGTDVKIYYTLDNSAPTASSLIYNPADRPKLAANRTLKAFAAKPGMLDSIPVSVTAGRDDSVFDISYILKQIVEKRDSDGLPGFTRADVLYWLSMIQPKIVVPVSANQPQ